MEVFGARKELAELVSNRWFAGLKSKFLNSLARYLNDPGSSGELELPTVRSYHCSYSINHW